MPKKILVLFVLLFAFLVSPLRPAEKQVRVIVGRAPIYAESNTNSYKIETVKKGTILTLFESRSSDTGWLYARYNSERWKSVVTGFIQASMVEDISEEPPTEKPEPAVLQREIIKEGALPKPEKPAAKQMKIEPTIEQVLVEESMGVSSLPISTSFAMPELKGEKKPRFFMFQETSSAATQSLQKQEEAVIEAEKKAPKKLEERQPPEKEDAQPESVPQIITKKPPQPKKPRPSGEWSIFTLSVGYGPAQGSGLGGFVQVNTKMGLSLHLGAGYYPASHFYSEHDWVKDEVLFSAGMKYYLPFKSTQIHPYLSLQYGGLSVEAVRLVTGIWHYQYIYENIQKTLYGPSLLAGIEIKLGMFGLNGALGLSYNTTEWDYWERDYFLTADVGLLIFLW